MIRKFMCAAAFAAMAAAVPAQAAYVIDFAQSGSDVVATGSGSLDITALSRRGNGQLNSLVIGANGFLITGSNTGIYNVYQTVSGPGSFGSLSQINATSSTGSRVGIAAGQFLAAPQDYVSGTSLGTTTTTFANATFDSLGLNGGSYVWTWGTGGNADSFTINIPAAAAAVPEPATWALLLLGFAVVGTSLRSRRGKTMQHAAA